MKQLRRHATLADVAEKAGVGKATVSRVINGARKVSPATLERVNKAIRELNFQPSQAARSLKGEITKTVGLVLPRIADPFFASCAEAIQGVVRSHEHLLMIAATEWDSRAEIDEICALFRHRVDGILLAPSGRLSRELSAVIDRIKIPVVAFNHPLRKSPIRSVVCDNYRGAMAATQHLLEHGHRRILCLGGDARLQSIRERQKGYKEAMLKAGLRCEIRDSANDYAAVQETLRSELLRNKPVRAIFAVRNLITIYAFQAIQELGLRIPEDVALIGFDDFDLACTLRPAVSVVKQPVEAIGEQAADLLFRELQRGPVQTAGQSKIITLSTTLVLRNSCGCQA